jgi:phage shock protein PspC (stress-responsive transcriptional regulator)
MNKTLTINIGGIVFNIEVDAYEKLDHYLKEIKFHFTAYQGKDEIMADIENRIAEMFQEKVGNSKAVLIIEDIDRVIKIMGNPEDFSDSSHASDKKYTDFENSNFQNYKSGRRRVYRDGENRVIGGVCSGIANYFDIDSVWIRLGLVVCFFLAGSGFLLYLILWITLPEAKTTAEKLEMRGEAINVDNISKTIKDEFDRVNESAKKFANDTKEKGSKFGNSAKEIGNKFADFISSIANNFIRIAGKFIAIIFIFFGVVLLTVILASLLGNFSAFHLGNSGNITNYSFREIMLLIFNNENQIIIASIAIMLITSVPLLMIVYKGVRIIFRIKQKNKILNISALLLFIIGICLSIYVFIEVAQDFNFKNKQVQKVTLTSPKNNVLFIKGEFSDQYDDDNDFDEEDDFDNDYRTDEGNLLKISDEGILLFSPEFDVIPSKTDSFELLVIKTARGNSKKIAYERASNINYKFYQNDSNLILRNFFELNKDEKWRVQNLKIILKVPIGKSIYLSKSLKNILHDLDNVTNTHDSKMMNRQWIMTQEGLTCIDCDGINTKNKKSRFLNQEDIENNFDDLDGLDAR